MNARLVRRTIAVLLAATLGLLALTGCGDNARSTITSAQAHRQILHYLQETAGGFPAGTRLSVTIPGVPASGLGSGRIPGNLDDGNPEQPYGYNHSMWVLLPGATADEPLGLRGRDILVDSWRSRHYSVDEHGGGFAVATTPDGYTIAAHLSAQNDLSVSVESPYFPKSQLDDTLHWPTDLVSGGSGR